MSDRYILNAHGEPEKCDDLMAWARWMAVGNRVVKQTTVLDARVSTVFLGIDHSFTEGAAPILWETLVFGGPLDDGGERYATLDAAIAGHEAWVQKVVDRG